MLTLGAGLGVPLPGCWGCVRVDFGVSQPGCDPTAAPQICVGILVGLPLLRWAQILPGAGGCREINHIFLVF